MLQRLVVRGMVECKCFSIRGIQFVFAGKLILCQAGRAVVCGYTRIVGYSSRIGSDVVAFWVCILFFASDA